jgi:hypothetical protein
MAHEGARGDCVLVVRNQQASAKVGMQRTKNAGLKVVTLIATLNPVSQVLW